jgi:hypothetical protein
MNEIDNGQISELRRFVEQRLDKFETQLVTLTQAVAVAQTQFIAHVSQDDERQRQWIALKELHDRKQDERDRILHEWMIKSETDRSNIRSEANSNFNSLRIEIREGVIRVLWWVVGIVVTVNALAAVFSALGGVGRLINHI